MQYTKKIYKQGDSLAVLIPKPIRNAIKDDYVHFQVKDKTILLKPGEGILTRKLCTVSQSTYCTFPSYLVQKLQLKVGDTVTIDVIDDSISIQLQN